MTTCDELIATELVFANALTDMAPEEIVALLSGLVFQEKIDIDMTRLTKTLNDGITTITDTAKRVAEEQLDVGMDTPTDEYVRTALHWGLVEVVYAWASNTSDVYAYTFAAIATVPERTLTLMLCQRALLERSGTPCANRHCALLKRHIPHCATHHCALLERHIPHCATRHCALLERHVPHCATHRKHRVYADVRWDADDVTLHRQGPGHPVCGDYRSHRRAGGLHRPVHCPARRDLPRHSERVEGDWRSCAAAENGRGERDHQAGHCLCRFVVHCVNGGGGPAGVAAVQAAPVCRLRCLEDERVQARADRAKRRCLFF